MRGEGEGAPAAGPTVEEVLVELQRLVERLGRAPSGEWRRRRDAVREVVQRLADLDADLEGEPRRSVPRLRGDPALVDQLAVVGADAVAAAGAAQAPDVLGAVAEALRGLRRGWDSSTAGGREGVTPL